MLLKLILKIGVKMTKINARSQWLALNRIAYSYKIICFCLSGCLIFSLSLIAYMAMLPPVVIDKNETQNKRYSSTRQNIEIGKNEIKVFVKTFIKANYQWVSLNKKTMLLNIHPFVTKDFYKLLKGKSTKKVKPEEQFSQYIGNLNISVTDKDVVAQFDRIIRLKGIPLISVTQISLQILKDSPNQWNPLGLYVNGLIEHEGN
jgi:hypothetical protein